MALKIRFNMGKEKHEDGFGYLRSSLPPRREYPELPQKITDETPAQKTERMVW